MPMLAERRRKTKWTNLGRQALWKRDSGDATFGREMMEKMGWKVGQGLGANEQGIKEPLRISFKNDNKGMGFKDNDNEWIQQQSEFDEFLSKLSSEKKEVSQDSQTNAVQSLEEKSRLSKARVHYHKFTRGKDLANYSKRDLECIMGRNEKESTEISGNMENHKGNVGNEDKSLITAGSMVDYFAKKMQSKKRKEHPLNFMDHEIEESSLGSRSKNEPEENLVESTMEFNEKRKKKSKKKKEKDEDGCNEAPCDEMDIDNSDYRKKSSSEGGKKCKKTKMVQEHDLSDALDGSRDCDNGTAETELVGIPVEKEEKEDVAESTMEFYEKRKKKSKKKKEKDEDGCNEAPYNEMDIDNSDYRKKSSSEGGKKCKKTKIVQEHDVSVALGGSRDCDNGTAETELVGVLEEKEYVNEMNLEGDEVLGERGKKKKKKRKKEENLVEQFDTGNVEALNVLENKDEECKGTEEKADSLTSAEEVRKKKKTSKQDRRAVIDEDDEGASKEKIKRRKKCLEAENRFNYEDCGTNENDLNPVSHTETNFKKEKENRKTKCENAVGNEQETRKDERERIAGEDPLYYKGELLKKENSLKGTSRNKLLNLIYSTNIEQFSGSNLGRLSGYGVLSHR